MVVFCVQTKQDKLVKDFVKSTHKRLTESSMATFFFKRDSFAYLIQEKEHYLLIINIETIIFNFPRWIYYPVMKKGLRKIGYQDEIKLANNNKILLKLAKVFKNLPKRNSQVAN